MSLLESKTETALQEDQKCYKTKLFHSKSTKYIHKHFKYLRNLKNAPDSLQSGNISTTDKGEESNLMNSYFHSVFNSSHSVYDAALPVSEHPVGMVDDYDVSEDSKRNILSNLDVRKSRGPDEIPLIFYKNLFTFLSISISVIFSNNKGLRQFPARWSVDESPQMKTPVSKFRQ